MGLDLNWKERDYAEPCQGSRGFPQRRESPRRPAFRNSVRVRRSQQARASRLSPSVLSLSVMMAMPTSAPGSRRAAESARCRARIRARSRARPYTSLRTRSVRLRITVRAGCTTRTSAWHRAWARRSQVRQLGQRGVTRGEAERSPSKAGRAHRDRPCRARHVGLLDQRRHLPGKADGAQFLGSMRTWRSMLAEPGRHGNGIAASRAVVRAACGEGGVPRRRSRAPGLLGPGRRPMSVPRGGTTRKRAPDRGGQARLSDVSQGELDTKKKPPEGGFSSFLFSAGLAEVQSEAVADAQVEAVDEPPGLCDGAVEQHGGALVVQASVRACTRRCAWTGCARSPGDLLAAAWPGCDSSYVE